MRARRPAGAPTRPLNFTVRWQVQRGRLLERTRQWWKLRLSILGVVISLLIPLVPRSVSQGAADRELLFYAAVSALLAAGSLIVLFWGISCPHCGAKWVQLSARQPGGRWLQWLLNLQSCPRCGSSGNLPPNNRWRGP